LACKLAPTMGLGHPWRSFATPRWLRRPERWDQGIGGRLVEAVLAEARARGYDRAQLWTQADNPGAQRLYEGRGFRCSGWEKKEFGERILHYERTL
jgi:RimJ/RimL family protein N-acetyltransferase